MDDPWGSPWADELHQSVPAPHAKGADGLSLAPTTQGKNAVTTEKSSGSWDVPGGSFDTWAGITVVQDTKGHGDISGGIPSWETRGAGEIKKIDVNDLSPHWDESQPGSGHPTPKLSPSPLPKPTELARQPSPDPWASVAGASDADCKDMSEERGQDKESSSESAVETSSPETAGMRHQDQTLAKPKDTIPPTSTKDAGTTETASGTRPNDTQGPLDVLDEVKARKDADEVSRSSSSPSDHSHHDEGHTESPRTSLDEDTHRPEVHRHVSEKIQVLVEHYDALAKAQLEETAIVGRDSHSDGGEDEEELQAKENFPSEVGPEGGDKEMVGKMEEEDEEEEKKEEGGETDDDFGDFEEGNSQISEPVELGEQPSNDRESQVLGDKAPLQAPKESTLPTAKVPPQRASQKDFGRVEYMADISALNKLYPRLKPEVPATDPAEKLVVPDTIPHDSFASVEERKMWYRLSRYTTLRQHNSGDDDNTYIRVSWAESKVREETLKITGRWMEQDRISGRVVLGGDSKDGSLFGWNDPKAAPMPLATAFAMNRGKKKIQASATVAASSEAPKEPLKGHVESRPSSHSRSPPKQRRRSSPKASRTSEETRQRIQQPVASFGWSSEPQPVAPIAEVKPKPISSNAVSSSQKQVPSAKLQPATQTHQMPSSLRDWDAPPPTAKSSAPIKPFTTVMPNSSSEFNDDWGEMMSSPVIAAAPQMPDLRGLGHKKSQSLIGISPQPAQVPSSGPAAPSISFGSVHRSTPSLDGVSMPQMHNQAIIPAISSSSFPITSTSNAFNTTTTNTPSPTANSTYDPWASADFSVFDTPAPPPKPKSAPPPKPNLAQTHRQGAKSVSFESTRAAPPQRGNGKTRQEIEQDRIVASIIRGLPDLSYMLRR